MEYISLNLTALSPLAIRADHAPGGAATAPYIPGATLAGSLAAVYRQYYPSQAVEFERLFLSEQVLYPNLYPATFHRAEAQSALRLPVYPVPKTAQSCKRFPGFLHDRDDDGASLHGVHDSLFDWAAFELGGRTHTALGPLLSHGRECQRCHRAMHHFDGFYRRLTSGEAGQERATARVAKHLQTHTGIDRTTGTVQEGILYSREVFEAQARFSGLVKLPERLAGEFKNFIAQVGGEGLVRVGNGRTRGLGKVELTTETPQEQFAFSAFQKRLLDFNAALQRRVETASPRQQFYFTLTLHAPTILLDPLLRHRGRIDDETLQEIPALADYACKLIYQNAGVRQITGWSELWSMPRTNAYAIETGSVFLFALSGEPDTPFYQALFDLEEKGLGQRRAEGFGRVCISDPFHREERLS